MGLDIIKVILKNEMKIFNEKKKIAGEQKVHMKKWNFLIHEEDNEIFNKKICANWSEYKGIQKYTWKVCKISPK